MYLGTVPVRVIRNEITMQSKRYHTVYVKDKHRTPNVSGPYTVYVKKFGNPRLFVYENIVDPDAYIANCKADDDEAYYRLTESHGRGKRKRKR
jgi:hypothetical protein